VVAFLYCKVAEINSPSDRSGVDPRLVTDDVDGADLGLPEIVGLPCCVPLAEYTTPGTPGLSESLARFVPHHDAILMANHGVVTAGPDLLTARCRMETVEQFAKTTLVTELLGHQTLLSDRDVEPLLEARARYGVTFPPGSHQTRPITREAAESAQPFAEDSLWERPFPSVGAKC
jgi:hypothetical protein